MPCATRCSKPSAPHSAMRFLTCAGAKNSTGRGPGRPLPLPRSLPVGAADRAAVGERVRKWRVHGRAQRRVAAHVDIDGRSSAGSAVDVVVDEHLVVAARAAVNAALAGEVRPTHLDAPARRAAVQGRRRGRRRSCSTRSRQHHAAAPKKALSARKSSIRNEVVNSGRSSACTASCSAAIERVAAAAQVLVVDRVQLAPVRRAVEEAAALDATGCSTTLVGHRPVAVEALADRDARRSATRSRSRSPRPECSPGRGIAGRKEAPVAHRLAEGAVGDVVGGQREAVDAHARPAGPRAEPAAVGPLACGAGRRGRRRTSSACLH